MAVSPRAGKGTAFFLDSTAGSLVNLSSGITEVSISRGAEEIDITTFGDNDRNFLPGGLRDYSLSVSGLFSSTHAEVLDGIFGANSTATRSFELNPDGSTAAGRHLLKGECFMSSLEYTAGVEGSVGMSFELRGVGALTSTNN